MKFTYRAYRNLLASLSENGYAVSDYYTWDKEEKCVILRHDIDNDIGKALEIAKIEYEAGVRSTYFVLVSSDFYNVFSRGSRDKLKELCAMGHMIGLHFDEQKYAGNNIEQMRGHILKEAFTLQDAVGVPIKVVSMHRPSKEMLDADLEIPGIINSYGHVFFREFRYLSDSRRHWREQIEKIVNSGGVKRLHILTHAFWYAEKEKNLHDTVTDFVNSANRQRYLTFMENITALGDIMQREEIK